MEKALEQVLFVGGKAPEEKGTGPSDEMMERLPRDTDRPISRKQTVVTKLLDDQVKKDLTVIPVDYWEISFWK